MSSVEGDEVFTVKTLQGMGSGRDFDLFWEMSSAHFDTEEATLPCGCIVLKRCRI